MGLHDFASTRDVTPAPPSGTDPSDPPVPAPSQQPTRPADQDVIMADNPVLELLVDYNEKFSEADPTFFRDDLVQQTMSVLISHGKPNPLLVGPAGVGKTRIAEEIARRIAIGDPSVPDQLREKRLYELPVTNIMAGSMFVGQIEAKVQAVIEFASDPRNNALIFIDEIHQIVSTRDPSTQKISQILKPALARGEMSVIGATTASEARTIESDPAFARRFSRLVVNELTPQQTETVLGNTLPRLTAHYHDQITVTDDVLMSAVRVADSHARAGQHRPDNAITLLDRAMADRVLTQKRLIAQAKADNDPDLIAALSSDSVSLTRTRVADVARRLASGNTHQPPRDLRLLKDELHDRLRGQGEVLDQVLAHLQRDQLNLFPSQVPTTFMFAGPSGVGKTETVKIIARSLTDADPIALNMSEYHQEGSTSQIIGSAPGLIASESHAEKPFDTLESNPYRVILLDEFEKAHPEVQRLFLSAFDEGYIRNAQGGVLDFSKAVIIATTNAGRESLGKDRLGFGSTPTNTATADVHKALAEHFDAELLGRFSLLIGFNPLTRTDYAQIIHAGYLRQREQVVADQPRMTSILPPQMPDDEVALLTRTTYVQAQGGRPAERAVRRWIEDQVLAAQAAHNNNHHLVPMLQETRS